VETVKTILQIIGGLAVFGGFVLICAVLDHRWSRR
jgi:hypothetical protein